eukprot:GABW01004196.1.p1 GENE.GABW01004196.1~~GABW01004196.1.p1  ORF type:complete len:72 (+),score=0.20 GABW01004196.1:121-336(+)
MSDYWTRKEYIVRINENKGGGGASGLRKKNSKVETQTGSGVCKQCGEDVNECDSMRSFCEYSKPCKVMERA